MPKLAEVSSQAAGRPQTAEDNPIHKEIELRAYQIFVERGGEPGHDVEDWLQAESELLEAYTKPGELAKARAG